MKKILLKCSIKGCPRTKKIEPEDYYPELTVSVTSKCPWHDDGDFDQEQFYDKDGNELYWKPKDL